MTQSDVEDLLAVMKMVAERAGKVILAYYVEEAAVEARQKDDSSPVTDADEAAEEFILDALRQISGDMPIIAEEQAAAGELPAGYDPERPFWLVDPLDGTKEFLSKNGEFTVNIALIQDHEPVAGVVHAPALDMTWVGAHAQGDARGLCHFSQGDGPPLEMATRPVPEEGYTVIASRSHGDAAELETFLSNKKIAHRVTAGSSLKFCLMASARADLYPRFGRTMEWDTAAGQAILMAAGGRVDLAAGGGPLTYGKQGFENPPFIAWGAPAD